MYTYAVVEKALARVFQIPLEKIGALRARIKNFQRIGLAVAKPGKGKKISYEVTNVFYWAMALEFAEFGLDPTVIKQFLQFMWPFIALDLNDGKLDEYEYVVFYPALISAPPESIEGRIPYFPKRNVQEMAEFITRDVKPNDPFDHRFGVIHTGLLWRELSRALDHP